MGKYNLFGDEDDWAETVVKNLERIYDRIDKRESEKKELRENIKKALDDYQITGKLKYSVLLDIIEGYEMAVDDLYFTLVDFCASKIITAIRILEEPFLTEIRAKRIRSNLHQYFMIAVYYIAKIQTQKARERELFIQNSTLGIISHDVIPLYEKRSSHVQGYVDRKKLLDERENRDRTRNSDEDDIL